MLVFFALGGIIMLDSQRVCWVDLINNRSRRFWCDLSKSARPRALWTLARRETHGTLSFFGRIGGVGNSVWNNNLGWVFIFFPQQKLLENCKSRHFHQPTSTGWFAKLFNYLPIKVVFPFLLDPGFWRVCLSEGTPPRFQRLVPSELIVDLVKAWGGFF